MTRIARMNTDVSGRLDRIALRADSSPITGPVHWSARRLDDPAWKWSFGDTDAPIFIASITKLFTTAIVLQLVDERLIELDDAVTEILPPETVHGLAVLPGGADAGDALTIRHLLTQTSGIADYFEGRGGMLAELVTQDSGWTAEEALQRARLLGPKFALGAARAHYSDTNFQLLQQVLEEVTSQPYAALLQERVLEPTELHDTWLFDQRTISRFGEVAPILHRRRPLNVPHAMASTGAQGGIVSTLADATSFLAEYFGVGTGPGLFDGAWVPRLAERTYGVFGPLAYGLGTMEYSLPRIATLGGPAMPRLLGHSGSTGTVLYYTPEHRFIVAGAVNQIDRRQLSHQVLARIAMTLAR